MQVIVMRHGEATGLAHSMLGDSQRNLTPRGITQAQQAAQKIKQHFNVVKVISSTYNRAKQTAEQVAQACGVPVETTADISLSNTNIQRMTTTLELLSYELGETDTVVLVSHIPIVYLMAEVCQNNYSTFHFHTASFIAFDFNRHRVLGNSSQDYNAMPD